MNFHSALQQPEALPGIATRHNKLARHFLTADLLAHVGQALLWVQDLGAEHPKALSDGSVPGQVTYLKRAGRHPSLIASASSQNQRSPAASLIFVREYQGDQGV